MDSVSDLGSEHVIDKAVLGQPVQAAESGRRDHGVEVVAVAGHTGHGARDRGLDPLLELLGSRRHVLKGIEAATAILNEA